ncbi:M16 family metallopeptidase [Kitasatospora terrestris]|uniref:Peptidase M16 C-terminal domain-containing protein n=1 Tax=Kitasatospora terrestris TaxID=258051 RepID=A0ABP9ELD7_9ACTN
MKHEVIDTIPVLWAEAPGPLEAVLVFGCGARDETLRTLGVTHLIEHLAMSTLPRLHHDHNASVDLSLTQFTCTGRPEQVAAFLERVCTALGALPLERIEQEAGVLAAEGGRVADPQTGELLSRRYGIQGVGLAAYRGPGADRIPTEAVRETAARYFHAGNAVLVLTGPPPAGLRLPLPAGERPVRGAAQPVLNAGPSWGEDCVPGPGLALRGDLDDQALALATQVLAQRLRETVRHRHGLSYDVGSASVYTGPGTGERTISLDAREGQEQKVAELLWEEALRLARDGVTEQELADEVESLREVWQDPRSTVYELGEAAAELLFDGTYRAPEARLAEAAATTPEQVRQAFAAALDTALVVVPEDVELDVRRPDGSPLPQSACTATADGLPAGGRVFRAPLLDRLRYGAARRARLVVTDAGLYAREPDGTVHHVPYTEVVGVEMRGPGRIVFGRSTCVIPLLPDLWADLGPAVRAVDAAVPAELRYAASALRPAD